MASSRPPGWPARQPTLTAGPFLLRPWRASDIDDVYAACQDESIQRWTTVPSPYRREDAVEFVERLAPLGFAEGREAAFAIVSPDDGRLLGSCALRVLGQTTGEIGYWVAADARGLGVARAATAALIDFGMGSLGMSRIEIVIEPENVASRAVAESCGAVDEGVVAGRCQSRTGPLDAVVYAVERPERGAKSWQTRGVDHAPLDEAHVVRLLRTCSDSLTLLRRERGVSWDRMADPLWLPGVTYLMVTAVGACIAAAQHVCGAEQWGAPGDDGSAMRVLGEHGVLTPATAEAMRQLFEFRAALLRASVDIDEEVILARLADSSALERFVAEVGSWLAAVGRD